MLTHRVRVSDSLGPSHIAWRVQFWSVRPQWYERRSVREQQRDMHQDNGNPWARLPRERYVEGNDDAQWRRQKGQAQRRRAAQQTECATKEIGHARQRDHETGRCNRVPEIVGSLAGLTRKRRAHEQRRQCSRQPEQCIEKANAAQSDGCAACNSVCCLDRDGGSGPRSLGSCDAFAGEHGGTWKKTLAAGDGALEVVEEFEIAFAKFEHRDVGRRAHLECPAVLEHRERP